MTKNCIVDLVEEFTSAKLKAEYISKLMLDSELLADRGQKICACGTYIGFNSNENDSLSVTSANFCRQRLCPMCQRRRSLRTYSAVSKVYDLANKSGYQFLHVVLTVPNCPADALNKTCDFLFKQSSLLFRKSDDVHTKAACKGNEDIKKLRRNIKNSFKGVFRALEITFNDRLSIDHPFAFHPHLHCLIAVKKSYFSSRDYISHEKLQKVWGTLTGIDNVQVFIGRVTDQCASIAEVAKYAVKPFKGDVTVEVLETLHKALFNRRLVQTFGVFRDWMKQVGVTDLEEVLDEDVCTAPDVWMEWEGGVYTLNGV
jgi:plasmid rolling circle replication initiator protein Rep